MSAIPAALVSIAAALGSSFAVAIATVPAAIRIGNRLGITAKPATPVDSESVPVFGGASIIAAILVALAAVGELQLWILAGAGALLVAGIVDDAIPMRPRQKFVVEVVVVGWALSFALPPMPLTPWHAADIALAGLWLVATINAFNFIDGLDGLAAGIGIVISMALAATGILRHDQLLTLGSFAIGGALAGFMLYNFPPATIFMGDAGALPLGFILGVLALRGGVLADNTRLAKYVFPALVMAVPLLNTAIVTVTRLATGNPISRGGLDHSHNRLRSLGLSDRKVVAVSCAVASVAAACGVAANILAHAYVVSALPLITLAAAVIALFMMDLSFDARPPAVTYGYVQGLARIILSFGYKRRLAEAGVDLALISAAYFGAFALRLDFGIDSPLVTTVTASMPWVLLVTYPAFFLAGVYRGIWRYTGLSDGIRFANGAALSGIFLAAGSMLFPIALSGSIVVLYSILLFNLLVFTRVSFRAMRMGISRLAAPDERVLVVGAGEVGAAAADYMFSAQGRSGVRLVGFIDEDGFKRNKLVHGQRVLGTFDDLAQIYRSKHFSQLLIADESLPAARLAMLSAFAERHGVTVHRFSIQVDRMGETRAIIGGRPRAVSIGEPRAV